MFSHYNNHIGHTRFEACVLFSTTLNDFYVQEFQSKRNHLICQHAPIILYGISHSS